MSLPHALLTALLEQPSTGFELAKRFDRSMSYYWHATHQQIYRELARMEKSGQIATEESADSKSRVKTYYVLAAGKAELERWVQTPSDITPLRESLMIKLRADAVIGPLALEAEVKQRILVHQQRLAIYQQLEAQYFAEPNPNREMRLKHLILQTGMRYEQHCLDWSNHVLEVLASDL